MINTESFKGRTHRAPEIEKAFNSTVRNKIKLGGLDRANVSPAGVSGLSSEMNKTTYRQNGVPLETIPDIAAAKYEQAGSCEQFARKRSVNDCQQEIAKLDSRGVGTEDQQMFSHSTASVKSIHNLHEEKRQQLLTKYSKENLMKSVKQNKNIEKKLSNNNNYLSQVSGLYILVRLKNHFTNESYEIFIVDRVSF